MQPDSESDTEPVESDDENSEDVENYKIADYIPNWVELKEYDKLTGAQLKRIKDTQKVSKW